MNLETIFWILLGLILIRLLVKFVESSREWQVQAFGYSVIGWGIVYSLHINNPGIKGFGPFDSLYEGFPFHVRGQLDIFGIFFDAIFYGGLLKLFVVGIKMIKDKAWKK